jgi:hypothetical protein
MNNNDRNAPGEEQVRLERLVKGVLNAYIQHYGPITPEYLPFVGRRVARQLLASYPRISTAVLRKKRPSVLVMPDGSHAIVTGKVSPTSIPPNKGTPRLSCAECKRCGAKVLAVA